MKVINVMNFVRECEPRQRENFRPVLFETTKKQLELCLEMGIDHTFLLQYDALCDKNYVDLFASHASEHTELGLWYEIVAPQTYACGLPYESDRGWLWDWHIKPGFPMSYDKAMREKLADEAMRKFKEVFGYYPRTVAGWAIDTHTVNYLADRYDVDAFAYCRDQTNTDAYTFRGGYFNQGYYPSRQNMFIPAQTEEYRLKTPVFRLLGSCPIFNYDGKKYLSEEMAARGGCYTMESVWYSGYTPSVTDWFYKTYFENPDLGFSYTQIGQENSFGAFDLITPLRMQIEKGKKLPGVVFQKMGDTGAAFKKAFPNKTPATSVVATDNWDTDDLQSAYYDCENYVFNLFRYRRQTFVRLFYLFDERQTDTYETTPCTTFDAVYESLPMVDTLEWCKEEKENIGLLLDTDATPFAAEQTGEGELTLRWGEKRVVCREGGVTFTGIKRAEFHIGTPWASVELDGDTLTYTYKDRKYALRAEDCRIEPTSYGFAFLGESFTLIPERK